MNNILDENKQPYHSVADGRDQQFLGHVLAFNSRTSACQRCGTKSKQLTNRQVLWYEFFKTLEIFDTEILVGRDMCTGILTISTVGFHL
jgi:hypothetical protein